MHSGNAVLNDFGRKILVFRTWQLIFGYLDASKEGKVLKKRIYLYYEMDPFVLSVLS